MNALSSPKITNKRLVMAAVLVATFLSAIEGTIVTTAMPRIVSDLGGVDAMSWVVSIYLLTTVITTPIYGKAADLYGRKIVFTFGSILFLIGSMLSGMSDSMLQLIIFRAIQGLGAGALLPVTLTIIGDIYPFEQRAKMQGWLSVIWGIAGILGPVTGGVIVDYISWHWIFYLNVPFGLLALILLWMSLHESFEKKKQHIDYPGVICFTLCTTALLLALLQGGTNYAWRSPYILTLLATAMIFFIAFIQIERKSPEPMLPLRLFTIRIVLVSNMIGFLISAVLVAMDFYIPLWIQGVYGRGATYSGLMLIPMTVTWTIGSLTVGRILHRFDLKQIIICGLAFIAAGGAGLATLTLDSPQWLIAAYAAVCGLGFGAVFTSQTVAIQTSVDWKERGSVVGSNSFLRTLGQVLGIALFGSLLNQSMAARLSEQGLSLSDSQIHTIGTGAANNADSVGEQGLIFQEVLSHGLGLIFVILAVVALVAFVLSFATPHIGKQKQSS